MLGETLAQVQEHKCRGVTIADDLTWNSHYGGTVSKANKILGLLQKNIYQCSKDTKAKAYKALVWPHLEYAAAVTDPYQSKYIQMLDKSPKKSCKICCWWLSSQVQRYQNDSRGGVGKFGREKKNCQIMSILFCSQRGVSQHIYQASAQGYQLVLQQALHRWWIQSYWIKNCQQCC